MAETITVASRAHTAILIREPLPEEYKDKPGSAPALKTVTLMGGNDPSALGGVGITHGVDPVIFHAWLDAEKEAKTPLSTLVYEVSGDDATGVVEFGMEPGLKRMADDAENAKAAEEGSTAPDGAPVKASDMAATSDTPNDDTPRGDPTPPGVVATQKPATAITSKTE